MKENFNERENIWRRLPPTLPYALGGCFLRPVCPNASHIIYVESAYEYVQNKYPSLYYIVCPNPTLAEIHYMVKIRLGWHWHLCLVKRASFQILANTLNTFRVKWSAIIVWFECLGWQRTNEVKVNYNLVHQPLSKSSTESLL